MFPCPRFVAGSTYPVEDAEAALLHMEGEQGKTIEAAIEGETGSNRRLVGMGSTADSFYMTSGIVGLAPVDR